MDPAVILANIERLLHEQQVSADRVAREAGVPDAIRNLRRAVRGGKGGITMRTLGALARQLGVAPAALLEVHSGADKRRLEQLLLEQRELMERLLHRDQPKRKIR